MRSLRKPEFSVMRKSRVAEKAALIRFSVHELCILYRHHETPQI
jgi:hypothetical protein